MNCFYTKTTNPLHFFTCGNLISKDSFLHQKRTLDCHVLILVLEGVLHITQAEQPFSVHAGQYLFLKAGKEHYGHKSSSGKLSYLWVHFSSDSQWEDFSTNYMTFFSGNRYVQNSCVLTSENIPTLPRTFTYLLPEFGTASSPQRISILFHQLMDFSRQDHLYTDSLLSYSLSLLLMELTQEFLDMAYDRNPNVSPIVHAVSEWLKSNCHKQLSLHDIAAEFHYNAEYLSSLFKAETGLTLMQYLNRSRIDISKMLLSSSGISIKEAAYSCGFHDEKYYMKMFKKYEGMTPLQYKNAFHKKQIN